MKRVLFALSVVLVLCMQVIVYPVKAAEQEKPVTETTEDGIVTATYLITSYSLFASNSNGKLCISGSTIATTTMKSVGFTDIIVERSSNGSTGWTAVAFPDDVVNSNASSCYFNNKLVTVTSGYYYRVTCNHYAKQTGWFPKTQSISNTSNAVYIG